MFAWQWKTQVEGREVIIWEEERGHRTEGWRKKHKWVYRFSDRKGQVPSLCLLFPLPSIRHFGGWRKKDGKFEKRKDNRKSSLQRSGKELPNETVSLAGRADSPLEVSDCKSMVGLKFSVVWISSEMFKWGSPRVRVDPDGFSRKELNKGRAQAWSRHST